MLKLTLNRELHAWWMAKAHRLTPLTRAMLWSRRGEQETTLGGHLHHLSHLQILSVATSKNLTQRHMIDAHGFSLWRYL